MAKINFTSTLRINHSKNYEEEKPWRPADPVRKETLPVSSESDVVLKKEKTEPEPLSGLASVFLMVEPDESKLAVVGVILLFIIVSLIVLNFLFRLGAKKQNKKRAVKLSVEKQKISPESFRHENNIGLDAAAHPPLSPIKK